MTKPSYLETRQRAVSRLLYLAARHEWERRQAAGDPAVQGVPAPTPEQFTRGAESRPEEETLCR